jgi:hypothetical protein
VVISDILKNAGNFTAFYIFPRCGERPLRAHTLKLPGEKNDKEKSFDGNVGISANIRDDDYWV